MTVEKVNLGNKKFRLQYGILFFDGRKSGFNSVVLSEVIDKEDAENSFRKYLEFLFKDEDILPEFDFYSCTSLDDESELIK